MIVDVQREQVAVRDACNYFLLEEKPEFGRWWAIRLVPVQPPGQMERMSNGTFAQQFTFAAAEQRLDGKWIWCSLSPAAKQVFGDLMFDYRVEPEKWYYVYEFDQKIAAAAAEDDAVEMM